MACWAVSRSVESDFHVSEAVIVQLPEVVEVRVGEEYLSVGPVQEEVDVLPLRFASSSVDVDATRKWTSYCMVLQWQ